MRRGRERDVALAGQQARGRVEADPPGARQINLGPGMQVGEVAVDVPSGPSSGSMSGLQLDQVARDEARGETEVAQNLHQQPGGVAARACASRQRLVWCLHARFHADDVADLLLQIGVELDQEIDGESASRGNLLQEGIGPAARARLGSR